MIIRFPSSTQGGFSALVRATSYGPVEYKPTNEANDETFSAKTLLDVDVACEVLPGVRLSAGANNLLNTFSDEQEKSANVGSRGFVYRRQGSSIRKIRIPWPSLSCRRQCIQSAPCTQGFQSQVCFQPNVRSPILPSNSTQSSDARCRPT